ncbi:MAG: hypothetical protein ACREP6_11660 [Candidatus Binataceae bacterium]
MENRGFSRNEFIKIGIGSLAGLWLAARPSSTLAAGTSAFVDGKENLKYNNPFHQKIEPVWIHGKECFHLDLGATSTKPDYKIAEQYLVLYERDYRNPPKSVGEFVTQAKMIVGKPIFDSDPNDANYSPIWHNNWVLAPKDYKIESLKSAQEVKSSGHKIVPTQIWVN